MAYPAHGLTPAALGVDPDTPNVDRAIDRAVGYARRVCGWHIFPAITETMTVDGEGGRVLTLPTLHVSDVTRVEENDSELDSSAYEWSRGGDLKRLNGCWTTRWRGVSVTLTHGFDLDDGEMSALLGALSSAVEVQAAAALGIPEVIGPFQFSSASAQAWTGTAATVLDGFRLPWKP